MARIAGYRHRLAGGAAAFALLAGVAGAIHAQPGPGSTTITVTTVSDASNGDTSGVQALTANPGRDGISLREAIEATNNDPGTYTIGFAPALRGKTLTLVFDLPPLTGGGVTVEGDIDGNGKPDVTLRTTVRSSGSPCGRCGFQISSSSNRLHALALRGFTTGVFLHPYGRPGSRDLPPSHKTYADNVVSRLVMRGMRAYGIDIRSGWSPSCGVPKPRPCRTFDRWANTTFAGNTIESGPSGIAAELNDSGDSVAGATVTGNRIRVHGQDAGIKFTTGSDAGDDATPARISDVLIARNTVDGEVDIGINVAAGANRAQSTVVDGVRVLANRVHLVKRKRPFCCQGIVVQAGSDSPEAASPHVRPLRYPDRNVAQNVQVSGNSVSGTLVWGVQVVAGLGAGGSRNRVRNVRVERNEIHSSTRAIGAYVVVGDGTPFRNRYATGNRISGVAIDANRIAIGKAGMSLKVGPGGVVLQGGGDFGRDGTVTHVAITNNRIVSPQVGIWLVGGLNSTAHANRVTCVRLRGNRITGTRNSVSVSAGAPGNRASRGGC